MFQSFVVRGEVRGKPRPRFSARGGYGRAYTPASYMKYERSIAKAYTEAGGKKFSGAVSVSIFIHRELPKSRSKRLLAELDTSKPDIDNVAKAVLDALNGVAYDDDKQVTSLHVTKLPRTRQESFLRVTVIGG